VLVKSVGGLLQLKQGQEDLEEEEAEEEVEVEAEGSSRRFVWKEVASAPYTNTRFIYSKTIQIQLLHSEISRAEMAMHLIFLARNGRALPFGLFQPLPLLSRNFDTTRVRGGRRDTIENDDWKDKGLPRSVDSFVNLQ
jgi:hypothetical protein